MTEFQIILLILVALIFVASIFMVLWARITRKLTQQSGDLAVAQALLKGAETELLTLRQELEKCRVQRSVDSIGFTAKTATLESENRFFRDEMARRDGDHKLLTDRFEQLSGEILRRQGSEFSAQSIAGLKLMLDPVSDRINAFGKTIAETYEKGLKDQIDLRSEIKKLTDLNQQISADATALTQALRTDTAAQGSWGEVVLLRVLERSGLVEGEGFLLQPSVRDDDGTLWRPDVVILLLENRHLIVDAKVSLTAWDRYVNAPDDASRKQWLDAHTESVRRHVQELGRRDYSSLPQFNTPDFVVLFMPIEAAFGAALQHDASLFGIAWEKRVVLTGPATLLATLRTVASVWRIEQQNRNVREIARQGGLLHDKLIAFSDEMIRVGVQIDRLKNTWQKASDRLSTGKGNLVSRAARLRQLGANTKSEPVNPENITDKIDDEDEE